MSDGQIAAPLARRRRNPVGGRGTTQDAVRRHNLAALLWHVHTRGSTSRADLTRALGLNRSTIAALVDDLAARHLVEECTATERGTPGRPSNLVRLRSDRVAVLAVALGVDAIMVAAVAPGGEVLDERQVALDDEPARSFERVLGTVVRESKTIVNRLPAGVEVTGVGVAVPGVVRREDGMVHHAPNLGWKDVPLGARLEHRLHSRIGLDVRVTCSNDASLGALAEHTRGTATEVSNLVYVYGEVGVGGGIVVDGHLLEGANGYGGEVGHMRVNPDGAPCRCGSRGCWETEIGEDVLVALAGRRPGGRAVVDEVLQAARDGEPGARRALDGVARWAGIGLANLVNCLNPEMVVLGGLLGELLDLAGPEIRAQMRAGLVTPAHLSVHVVPARLGAESVLLGAAEVALGPVLEDPTLVAFV